MNLMYGKLRDYKLKLDKLDKFIPKGHGGPSARPISTQLQIQFTIDVTNGEYHVIITIFVVCLVFINYINNFIKFSCNKCCMDIYATSHSLSKQSERKVLYDIFMLTD